MGVKEALELGPDALAVSDVGLWGSPSLSEKAWCLRWSATQEITGPSIAAEPRAPITARTAGPVLKLRWVKRRWKPTVMPRPVGM